MHINISFCRFYYFAKGASKRNEWVHLVECHFFSSKHRFYGTSPTSASFLKHQWDSFTSPKRHLVRRCGIFIQSSHCLQQRNIGNMRILNGIGWIKYKRKVIVQNIISYSIKYFLITCNLISQTYFSLESVLLTKKFFLFDFSFVRDNNSTNLFACRVNIVDEKLLVSITVLWWE